MIVDRGSEKSGQILDIIWTIEGTVYADVLNIWYEREESGMTLRFWIEQVESGISVY